MGDFAKYGKKSSTGVLLPRFDASCDRSPPMAAKLGREAGLLLSGRFADHRNPSHRRPAQGFSRCEEPHGTVVILLFEILAAN